MGGGTMANGVPTCAAKTRMQLPKAA